MLLLLRCMFVLCISLATSEVPRMTLGDDMTSGKQKVLVNKCCADYELYIGNSCTHSRYTNESLWRPLFISETGEPNVNVQPEYVIGYPDCGSHQRWPVYNLNSSDTLHLFPTGVLRHYIVHVVPGEENQEEIERINGKTKLYHDYQPGKYCMEKRVEDGFTSDFAWVCAPKYGYDWTKTEFIMRNIISPLTHGVGIVCILIVALIYAVMPTLQDLNGNIVATLCGCLIVSQTADFIRLLTVFTSHISILITEAVCYFGLLAAFFWLNSLGFYIWKTFKSRNVFLRTTDGKKYCYYSMYVWISTLFLAGLAIFAHFTMDYPNEETKPKFDLLPEEIGSLGMIIFFVPVAFIVLANIFFFVTTLQIINRMHTYGRIHHKLRHSFRMFLLLLLTMTTTWLFFLMTLSKFDGLIYCYIVVNALQGPLILYICIFNQKHIIYLLRKTCCYTTCCDCFQPAPECEWGDEMTAMNNGYR